MNKVSSVLGVCVLVFFSASTFANVKSYFNQNPSAQYTEPYRGITRPGDNLEQVVLDQITEAKNSIYIAVQELRLPLVAQSLVEMKKKKPFLDIRVILEHDYNFTVLSQQDSTGDSEYEATKLAELRAFVDIDGDGKISVSELEARDAIYVLNKAKIPVIDDAFDNSKGSGLMHHKFMVVDGKTTVVSSANFTMSCIHGDSLNPQSRGNANSLVVVESAAFSKLFVEEFLQMWGSGKRGNFGHNKTYRGPQTVTVRGTKITVQFSPTSARYDWPETTNGLIASAIDKARSSIKAALFVFSDQKIADAMERKHDAGVLDIGVLIEPKFAFRDYSELLDLLGLRMLNAKCQYEPDNRPWRNPIKEAGMALLPKGDVLHHKFAVIDRKLVVMGSENWSDSANYTNDETVLIIENSSLADAYTQEYLRLKRKSLMGASLKVQDVIRAQETSCADRGFYF